MTTQKIVILHGWTYNLDKWINFVKLLENTGFEVELLKIPGLTEESHEVWDLEKYVNWLDKKIATKVIILGHSNGGRIAVAFTAKYPEKVEKLILIDSAGVIDNRLPIRVKRAIFGTAAKAGKRLSNNVFLRKLLYKLAREGDYEKASPNMRQTLKNMISQDLTAVMKSIKIPTQIIWGKDDRITPLPDAYLIQGLVTDSKLIVIPEAKHAPFYTHPEKTVEIIKNGI